MLWPVASHDRPELIDDPSVVTTVERACADMTRAVRKLAPEAGMTTAQQVVALRSQSTAVTAMVNTVRDLGPEVLAGDRPTEDWLRDWESLVSARDLAIDRIARGMDSDFQVPVEDGEPITTRMSGLDQCTVPATLLQLP